MALLKFLSGEESNLPEKNTDGSVYITTNTRQMYVDINGSRIHMNSVNGATEDNIAVFNDNGTIKDSGQSIENLKNIKYKEFSLDAGSWTDSTKTQTVSIPEVGANDLVIINSKYPNSASKFGIYCSNQSEGSLVFTYTIKPTAPVDMIITIQKCEQIN